MLSESQVVQHFTRLKGSHPIRQKLSYIQIALEILNVSFDQTGVRFALQCKVFTRGVIFGEGVPNLTVHFNKNGAEAASARTDENGTALVQMLLDAPGEFSFDAVVGINNQANPARSNVVSITLSKINLRAGAAVTDVPFTIDGRTFRTPVGLLLPTYMEKSSYAFEFPQNVGQWIFVEVRINGEKLGRTFTLGPAPTAREIFAKYELPAVPPPPPTYQPPPDFNTADVITQIEVFPQKYVGVTVAESGSGAYSIRVVRTQDPKQQLLMAGQCQGDFCYLEGSTEHPEFAASSGVLIGSNWTGAGRLDGHGIRRVGGNVELIIFDSGTYSVLVFKDGSHVARKTFTVGSVATAGLGPRLRGLLMARRLR